MGAIAKHGTTIIVLINTLFGLIGLVFLVAGCFVKFGADKLDELAQPLLEPLSSKIPDEAGIDLKNFKISEFVGGAATLFLVFGGVLLGMVVWAYCGIACKSKFMLCVKLVEVIRQSELLGKFRQAWKEASEYALLLMAVVGGEIALVVIVTKDRATLDNILKDPLKDSIENYYQGSKGKNAISMGWNALMSLMDCCGVDGASDFRNTSSWNHVYSVTPTTPEPNDLSPETVDVTSSFNVTLDAPVLCCSNQSTAPTCGSPTPKYKEGCYNVLWQMIDDHQSITIGVMAGFAGFQTILWLLTVSIVQNMSNKNKVRPN